jgi:polysaccharide biosynthesis protein PslH
MPYPLTDGGAIGIFNITKSLAELGHEIMLLTFPLESEEATAEAVQALSKYADVRLVSKPLPSRSRVLLRTIFRGAYPIERREMREMYGLIENVCRETQFDVVHVDHCHMGRYGLWIKQKFGVPIVLREHNVEFQIYERFAATEKNVVKRIIARVHGRRLRVEEIAMLQQFDRVVAISREDRALMEEVAPRSHCAVVPAGVDMEYFVPRAGKPEPDSILFAGTLDWDPNYDALSYFLNSIFPHILRQRPRVILDVVGGAQERILAQTAGRKKSIRLLGRVPDIRDYFATAAVVVVPLRIGGGIRIKILEAFAMKKAVVCTSIGVEGIAAITERDVLIRDNEKSFADAVCDVLASSELRKRIGENGYALVQEQYEWGEIARRFSTVYEEARSYHRHHADNLSPSAA